MIFHPTKLENSFVIEPEIKEDERGYFARLFCKEEFAKRGTSFEIIQINQSFTKNKGIIRGMHFQKEPRAEDKIVRCTKGVVYDVAIDLRPSSPTYGEWVAEELSEENKKMFFIPKGFAHGFQTLVDGCELVYLMSEFYSPEHASGVRFDDPFFNIAWPVSNPTLSARDKNWPFIKAK